MGRWLVREKGFYKTFYVLTAGIALQSLITFAVNLADNMMLGSYSEASMSGAALVNQIQFLLQCIISGVASGVAILAAQYWGKREIAPIRRAIALGLRAAVLVGALFTVVTLLFPVPLMRLLTPAEAVVAEGAAYLRILAISFIIFSVSNTLIMSLRSVETTMIGPVTSLATLLINVCLNSILIFGRLGAPELGVRGAAIATVISRVAELVIVLVYLFCFDRKIHLRVRHLFCSVGDMLRPYIRLSLPVVGSGAIWGLGQIVQTAILGHISETAIAANSIATIVYQILSVIVMASTNSSSVVIGKTIGEGRMEAIRPYARTMQLLYILHGLLSAALLFLLKDAIINLYTTTTPETKALASQFLTVLAVTVIGTAYEYPVGCGIIQGGGDTRYAFMMDNLFIWLICVPFAAMSAFWWNLPPAVTFLFLKSDQVLKCIPHAIKVNRFRWIHVLTESDGEKTA